MPMLDLNAARARRRESLEQKRLLDLQKTAMGETGANWRTAMGAQASYDIADMQRRSAEGIEQARAGRLDPSLFHYEPVEDSMGNRTGTRVYYAGREFDPSIFGQIREGIGNAVRERMGLSQPAAMGSAPAGGGYRPSGFTYESPDTGGGGRGYMDMVPQTEGTYERAQRLRSGWGPNSTKRLYVTPEGRTIVLSPGEEMPAVKISSKPGVMKSAAEDLMDRAQPKTDVMRAAAERAAAGAGQPNPVLEAIRQKYARYGNDPDAGRGGQTYGPSEFAGLRADGSSTRPGWLSRAVQSTMERLRGGAKPAEPPVSNRITGTIGAGEAEYAQRQAMAGVRPESLPTPPQRQPPNTWGRLEGVGRNMRDFYGNLFSAAADTVQAQRRAGETWNRARSQVDSGDYTRMNRLLRMRSTPTGTPGLQTGPVSRRKRETDAYQSTVAGYRG